MIDSLPFQEQEVENHQKVILVRMKEEIGADYLGSCANQYRKNSKDGLS